MLGTLAPTLADHRPDDERHADLPAVHVPALGRDVDELVHRQHQEVHADVDVDRAQAGHRHADRGPGHAVLGERRPEDALGAILLDEPARRPLDRLGVVHVEAHDDHAVVPLHLLVGGLAQRLDERDRPRLGDDDLGVFQRCGQQHGSDLLVWIKQRTYHRVTEAQRNSQENANWIDSLPISCFCSVFVLCIFSVSLCLCG